MPSYSASLSAARPGLVLRRVAPGLLLCAALAAGALGVSALPGLADAGLGPLTVAILLGLLVGNLQGARLGPACGPGLDVARVRLLRLGIVLFGLKLTLQDVAVVGWRGVSADVAVMTSTFLLACWVGTRWLGLDRRTAMLIGAGSSICGAAAVVATEPVVRARSEQVTVAVATVVGFGTLGMFVYPLLYHAGVHLGLFAADPRGYGIYVGSTVHEVAQVVVAARAVSPEAAATAVIAKMVRVLLLAPFLLALSAWLARRHPEHGSSAGAIGDAVPWFAVAFGGVVLLHSTGWLPAPAVHALLDLDTFVLAAAMAALGVATRWHAMRTAGVRPLLLATALFGWLVVGGGLINRLCQGL